MTGAVIFDLDDTLYDYKSLDREADKRVQDFVCDKLGIDETRYQDAYMHGRRETKEQLGNVGASHNRMLYFQKTLEYLDRRPLSLCLQIVAVKYRRRNGILRMKSCPAWRKSRKAA